MNRTDISAPPKSVRTRSITRNAIGSISREGRILSFCQLWLPILLPIRRHRDQSPRSDVRPPKLPTAPGLRAAVPDRSRPSSRPQADQVQELTHSVNRCGAIAAGEQAKWQMRWKPLGRTWMRKRRVNSPTSTSPATTRPCSTISCHWISCKPSFLAGLTRRTLMSSSTRWRSGLIGFLLVRSSCLEVGVLDPRSSRRSARLIICP